MATLIDEMDLKHSAEDKLRTAGNEGRVMKYDEMASGVAGAAAGVATGATAPPYPGEGDQCTDDLRRSFGTEVYQKPICQSCEGICQPAPNTAGTYP